MGEDGVAFGLNVRGREREAVKDEERRGRGASERVRGFEVWRLRFELV